MRITRLLIFVIIGFTVVKNGLSKDPSYLVTDDENYWRSINVVKNDLVHPRNLLKQEGQMQNDRPDSVRLPYSYSSVEGHFLIHYTLTGNDAVDPTVTNADGVPDYVYKAAQIAERSYRLLIDTLGFQPPPVDDESSPETDIYIVNWGGSVYAYTYDENPVLSTDQSYDYTAFTVIDNDYEEYATTGIAGLQVTIAHEYFHIVQLGYNWRLSNNLPGSTDGDTFFLEWCSTWFEERAYPEVNDYFYYISSFFYSPAKSAWNYTYAYALGPFLRFILDRYGEDLLVKVWNNIKREYAFQALQQVLVDDYGADLADLWNEFVYRCYFTEKRYDPELSLSSEARNFPLLQISNTARYNTTIVFNTTVSPFATVPYRVTFADNILCGLNVSTDYASDFTSRHLFIKHGIGQLTDKVTLNENQLIGDTGNGDSLLVFMTNRNVTMSRDLIVTVAEVGDIFPIASKIQNLFPNPYLPEKHENLTIELQVGQIVNSIKTTWFDLRGRNAYQKSFEDGLINIGLYNLTFSDAELRSARLASGVYLIRIEIGTKALTRKVLILK